MDEIKKEAALQYTQNEDDAAGGSDTVGRLQINVTANVGLIPIENASITVSFTGSRILQREILPQILPDRPKRWT